MQLYPAEKLNLGLSAGAVAASFAVATPLFAGSLAAGATLGSMNFRFLHSAAELVFQGAARSAAWLVVLGFRLVLVFIGMGAAMTLGADALGLVIGLSIVMPATVLAAVWFRPEHVPTLPGPAVAPDDPSWDEFSIWRPLREKRRREEDDDPVKGAIALFRVDGPSDDEPGNASQSDEEVR
ncbi:MAG: hypothetical protein QF570_15820 [Myxococcota bacterium]|jgi:hypothetical protein|nr:hypothetical protein [Myxococcota bacterium]